MTPKESFVLSIAAICVITIISILLILIPQAKKVQEKEAEREKICFTKECISAASNLLQKLDTSKDPCADFYNFSCGNFFKMYPIPDGKDFYGTSDLVNLEVSRLSKEILEEPNAGEDSDALIKAKTLYRSCLDKDHIESESVLTLGELLSKKGMSDWLFLETIWSDEDQEIEKRMAILNSLGIDSLFKFVVHTRGIDHSLCFGVYVAPPMVSGICSSESEDIFNRYKALVTSVFTLLGVAKSKSTEEAIDDIVNIERAFCNATKASREVPLSFLRSNITLQDMPEDSRINLHLWINLTFKRMRRSSERFPVYVYHVDKSMDAINQLVMENGRAVAIYLGWKFVLHHIGFLSQPFLDLYFKHEDMLKDLLWSKYLMVPRWMTSRWQDCEMYVRKMMPFAIIPRYLSMAITEDKQKELADVTSQLRNAFKDLFIHHPHLKKKERKMSLKKIESVKVQLYYPEREKAFFDDYYIEMKKFGDSFLENGIEVKKFHFRKQIDDVFRGAKIYDLEHLVRLYSPFDDNAWSVFVGDIIVVHFGTIHNTRVSYNRPKYLNFGSTGWLIGHEFTHGFDFGEITGLTADGDSPRNWTIWPQYVVDYVTENAQCLMHQYSQYDLGFTGKKIDGNLSISENMCDNQGMKEALKTYLKYVDEHGEEPGLPGVNFTNGQLFFIEYAQHFCRTVNEKFLPPSDYSPNNERVNAVLRNTEYFSEVFDCPKDSPMNPSEKCESVW